MILYNHLKDKDPQNLFLELAYGLHIVEGDLCKSLKDDAGNIYVQNKLGLGEWNKCRALWWRGFGVTPSAYKFYPGKLSSGNDDPIQGVDEVFSMDVPHSAQAWIRAQVPPDQLEADFNPAATAPEGLYGIFETKKINDYNALGNVEDFSYSTSGARQIADLFLQGNLPLSLIDFGAFAEWKAAMKTQILCDYRTLNIEGFGLSAQFFNGDNFNTLISERVDSVIEFALSAGSPAYGLEDVFSARWEGYIKPKFGEDYTFTLRHDDIGRLWIDDAQIIDGTFDSTSTATIHLNADQYHKIKVEWVDTTGLAEVRLQWESPSQPLEVVPSDRLYPLEKYVDAWESHIAWKRPTRLDDAVRDVLRQCNSGVQRVRGKYRFFCYDQLSTSDLYKFTEESNFYPQTVEVTYADLMQIRNVWQGTARDLDHQYLSNLTKPLTIERDSFINQTGQRIDGEILQYQNTTRFQLFRLLEEYIKRNADAPDKIAFDANCESYPVCKSDLVKLDLEYLNIVNGIYRVVTATDKSSEKTADDRSFVLRKHV